MSDAIFAASIEAVARHLLGEPNRKMSSRRQLRFGSHGALAVEIAGRAAGTWFDHETGTGGGAIDFVRRERRCDKAGALAWLRSAGFLDGEREHRPRRAQVEAAEPSRPAAHVEAEESQTLSLARAIWRESVPARGTIVETYLRARGVTLPPRAPIRFHVACPRGAERVPAMLALVTNAESNEACGVHRTFLRPDGSGKVETGTAKMMTGAAGVIRLSPDDCVTTGLGISEGVETGLALLTIAAWSPIWAAASAGGIAKFPVLPGIAAITLFDDRDDKGAGLRAATECAARWKDAGREARIEMPPGGTDWLDALTRFEEMSR